jgi:hypothetical protein
MKLLAGHPEHQPKLLPAAIEHAPDRAVATGSCQDVARVGDKGFVDHLSVHTDRGCAVTYLRKYAMRPLHLVSTGCERTVKSNDQNLWMALGLVT